MASKPYCPPPVAPPPRPQTDCGYEPEPPPPPVACEPCTPSEPPPPPGSPPSLDLTGLLGLLPNISITGDAGLLAPQTGLSTTLPVDISLINNESSSGGLNIDLSSVNADTPDLGLGGEGALNVGNLLNGVIGGGDGGFPLVSLDSGTDAVISVPVFGEDGVLSGSTDLGGAIDGGDGSLPLVSLDGGTDAVINVPLLGEDGALSGDVEAGGLLNIGGLLGGGGGSGTADVGSLLNAAMVDVGGSGCLGPMAGGDVYDGNVPLVGGLSSALGSTLDLLTTTPSLFDVPALGIIGGDSLDG